jgi:hypothetical protein
MVLPPLAPPLPVLSCAKVLRSLTATSCATHPPLALTCNPHEPPVEHKWSVAVVPPLLPPNLRFYPLESRSSALHSCVADSDCAARQVGFIMHSPQSLALKLKHVSATMHMAAYVDYQMSGWDAVHHMAAFAHLRARFCQRGGCSHTTSNFGELLDIGCNLGGISLAAAANGFDSVCVEALPSNSRRIAATISLNSHLPGHINMCAVQKLLCYVALCFEFVVGTT